MALKGTGVLAIWNGIAGGADEEFLEWHVKEHMPERVRVPGFLRGRRYAAVEADPAYFNFYEVESPRILTSPAYLDRLNDPSDWTRKVVSNFLDTARTICRVESSVGEGEAGFIAVMPFQALDTAEPARTRRAAAIGRMLERRGIVGAHVLLAVAAPAAETSENRLRSGPDVTWGAILMVEAVAADAMEQLHDADLASASLVGSGFSEPARRGLYRFEYALDATDLSRVASEA